VARSIFLPLASWAKYAGVDIPTAQSLALHYPRSSKQNSEGDWYIRSGFQPPKPRTPLPPIPPPPKPEPPPKIPKINWIWHRKPKPCTQWYDKFWAKAVNHHRSIATSGIIDIYERINWKQYNKPRFLAVHVNGQIIKEFKTEQEALDWLLKQE
jgi:hypothetical protein